MYLNLSKLILFRYNPLPWFVIIWVTGVTDVRGVTDLGGYGCWRGRRVWRGWRGWRGCTMKEEEKFLLMNGRTGPSKLVQEGLADLFQFKKKHWPFRHSIIWLSLKPNRLEGNWVKKTYIVFLGLSPKTVTPKSLFGLIVFQARIYIWYLSGPRRYQKLKAGVRNWTTIDNQLEK